MKRLAVWLAMAGVTLVFVQSAGAWSTKTQVAVATTAANILNKEEGIPLTNLINDIKKGAAISPQHVVDLIPTAEFDAIKAAESEIYLLQTVRSGRVDPYYAYRLGVLSKLVSSISAPLADARSNYRDRYFADVESNIGRAEVHIAKRTPVDPRTYFDALRNKALTSEELIIQDYKDGLGFNGVAGTTLSRHASSSINSIADVWQAVLRGHVVSANVSPSQVREYFLNALSFYIKRGNRTETENAYKRLTSLTELTPDFQKEIGDMFYDSGDEVRGIKEYQAVLAKSPDRRDIVERISAYYIKVGDAFLGEGQLEEALEAYQQASESDLLNVVAHNSKMDVEKLIIARNTRMDTAKQAVETGDQALAEAENRALRRDYAGALKTASQARNAYTSVTSEFPEPYSLAQRGLTHVDIMLAELQGQLMNSIFELSGAGTSVNISKQAQSAARDLSRDALKALNEAQYKEALKQLRREHESILP